MSSRTRKLRIAALFAFVAAAAGGLAAALAHLYWGDRLPAPVLALIFALILAVTFAGMMPWWRKLDHMQRDGHLTSWYWGGSFGGGLGLLLLLLVEGESGPLVTGAVLVWLAQVIGYAVALVAWKIAHRSAES